MEPNPRPRNTVDAVERAAGVIEALKDLDGAGVTELAEYLGMSKSGVYKQLSSLVNAGFVSKQDGEYQLSYRFMSMGEYVKGNSQLYQAGADEVDKLADKTGYFGYLVVVGGDDAYCLHTANGENAVVPNMNVGQKVSLHSSAAGKAILAHLPDDERSEMLDRALSQKTEATITSPETLRARLDTIRDQEVAFEDEENIPGMRGVGAPIEAEAGDTVGAVAVTGPLSLLTDDHFREELPMLVQQTKNFIEVKLSLETREPLKEGERIPDNLY